MRAKEPIECAMEVFVNLVQADPRPQKETLELLQSLLPQRMPAMGARTEGRFEHFAGTLWKLTVPSQEVAQGVFRNALALQGIDLLLISPRTVARHNAIRVPDVRTEAILWALDLAAFHVGDSEMRGQLHTLQNLLQSNPETGMDVVQKRVADLRGRLLKASGSKDAIKALSDVLEA